MAVKPTLLLSPDGSFDANGRVQPTLTGGVLVVPGQYGNAWQIAEATTNLIINPSVEVNTTGVAATWGGASGGRDTTEAHSGVASVRATTTGASSQGASFMTATNLNTINATYALSAWVKGPAGTNLRLGGYASFTDATAANSVSNQAFTATGEWQRVSVVTTFHATKTVNYFYVIVITDAAQPAVTFYVDDAQAEQKAYATPYADGSLGAGHAWTGTPHASTSTRSVGVVQHTLTEGQVNNQEGTMLVRFHIPERNSNGWERIAALGSWNNSFLSIGREGNVIRSYNMGVNGTVSNSIYSPPLTAGWHTASISWGTFGRKLFLDGVMVSHVPNTAEYSFVGKLIESGFNTQSPSGPIEALMLFGTALTDPEIAEYMSMQGALTWNTTFGPHGTPAFPSISSGLHLVETKIHKSDMYGNIGEEITGEVVSAGITSDLDRAGSKTHLDITAVGAANLLPAGSWVTPVQEISREGEGTIKVQRGVFELGQPEVESAGVRFIVSNSGKDIVDLLARSALLDTFYTPNAGMVMPDVEAAIRMLGITSLGANIVPNGSFESGIADWTFSGATSGAMLYSGVGGAPDGNWVGFYRMPADTARPSYGLVIRTITSQVVAAIAAGAKQFFFSAFVYTYSSLTVEHMLEMVFNTPSGNKYYNSGGYKKTGNGWERLYGVMTIPADYAGGNVQIYVASRPRIEHSPLAVRADVAIDDIQMRPCTGDLLPVSMLALPQSTTRASSRIQHLTSDARLAAVNDRLSAISMMAVNATSDSKYTSRMTRDPNKDASVRQYEIEKDIRITGDIQTWRNTSNKYNRVFAVKEDYTTGTSMTAIAENKDLDDPWNIYRSVLTPRRIDVRDAVDVATLQIAADQELAKASMQESVSFSIVPDPTLTVYDIIEIIGPDTNPAIGKWAIESIDSGLTASDPLMHIGARRTKKGV